jgi:GNAT superfamily N-acetyltransferase
MGVDYKDFNIANKRAYFKLFESTGWTEIMEQGPDILFQSIKSSWYRIDAYNNNTLVGMGRIISDGYYQAFICDLIVHPEYQGKGIGKEILLRLLRRCKEKNILMVSLFAARNKSEFYQRFGFEERPSHSPGMRWIDKGIL